MLSFSKTKTLGGNLDVKKENMNKKAFQLSKKSGHSVCMYVE